jgi:hypothetical protein
MIKNDGHGASRYLPATPGLGIEGWAGERDDFGGGIGVLRDR